MTKWTVLYPDGFEPLETGVCKNKDGGYTFSQAKKELIKSIDQNIRDLKSYKKEVRSSRESDWTEPQKLETTEEK